MMAADCQTENDIIDVLKSKTRDMPPLVRSHLAYLAGRVRRDRSSEMLGVLKQISSIPKAGAAQPTKASKEAAIGPQNFNRMLRRTVFISRSMLGDHGAPLEYADVLLTDVDESEFNRGFHLEYYGDAPFDPNGRMISRDEGEIPGIRTFARLMERIKKRPDQIPPLIELLTILALVQVRNLNGKLLKNHRREVVALLDGPQFRDQHRLPDKVRGYIGRVAEDLKTEDFRLSTVLEDWNGLARIECTGWLRRRRDAIGDAVKFWKDLRVESVAEHLVGVLGLADVFLTTNPMGEERYDKRRVIEMILVHDLAESKLGDQLPHRTDPKAEEEVLWQYGAFATYRGIGDLWRVPNLLQEFNRGETIDARVAKDLDRLQFILQARAYSAGMSADEVAGCESASQRINTATVRQIETLVKEMPKRARFEHPIVCLD